MVDVTTNRITGSPYAFDANGNMTNDGINTLTYDAENHAVSSSGVPGSGAYTYDGNGRRVKKGSGSTTTVYVFSGSKVIAEYDNGAGVTSPSREYVYGGSALLAKIDSSGTKYYHQDHLSNRLITNSTGSTVAQMGHFPFGESWYNATNDKLVFTSYERDAESGNDYAMARTYVNRLARFYSTDPLSGSIGSPQSHNAYAYVGNNPTNLVDPLGLCAQGVICVISLAPYPPDDGPPAILAPIFGVGGAGSGIGGPQTIIHCTFGVSNGTFTACNDPNGGRGAGGNTSGGPQQPQTPPTHCQQTVLNAVNNRLGTNLTGSNILPSSNPLPASGGQVNVNFSVNSGLSAAQFNAIQPGRFAPSGILGHLTGYGPSLHVVARPSSLDPTALPFANSNIGGVYSVTFTAHIDSANANNPIGALFHLFIDVFGHKTRNPCP